MASRWKRVLPPRYFSEWALPLCGTSFMYYSVLYNRGPRSTQQKEAMNIHMQTISVQRHGENFRVTDSSGLTRSALNWAIIIAISTCTTVPWR